MSILNVPPVPHYTQLAIDFFLTMPRCDFPVPPATSSQLVLYASHGLILAEHGKYVGYARCIGAPGQCCT